MPAENEDHLTIKFAVPTSLHGDRAAYLEFAQEVARVETERMVEWVLGLTGGDIAVPSQEPLQPLPERPVAGPSDPPVYDECLSCQ